MFTGRINTIRTSTILSVATEGEIQHFLCVGDHDPHMIKGMSDMPSGLSDTQFSWFVAQIKQACRKGALQELDPNMTIKDQPLLIRCNARRCPQLTGFLIDAGAVITEEIMTHYLHRRALMWDKFIDAIPVDLTIEDRPLVENVPLGAVTVSLIERGCELTPEIVTNIIDAGGKYNQKILAALIRRGIELDDDMMLWILQSNYLDDISCVLGTVNREVHVRFLIRLLHACSASYQRVKECTEKYGVPAEVILEAAVRAGNHYVASRFLDRVEKTDELIAGLKSHLREWDAEMLALMDGNSTLF
jgi:hypothetical protein